MTIRETFLKCVERRVIFTDFLKDMSKNPLKKLSKYLQERIYPFYQLCFILYTFVNQSVLFSVIFLVAKF